MYLWMNHYTVLALYFIGWTQKIPVSFWHICVHAQWRPSLQALGQQSTRLLCPWNFAGENTGVGCHFLLQEIFLTQGWNPHLSHLLHWQVGFSFLPPGKPPLKKWDCIKVKNFFKVKEVIKRVLLTIEENLQNGRKY